MQRLATVKKCPLCGLLIDSRGLYGHLTGKAHALTETKAERMTKAAEVIPDPAAWALRIRQIRDALAALDEEVKGADEALRSRIEAARIALESELRELRGKT